MGWNQVLGVEHHLLPERHSLYLLNYSIWYDFNVNIMVALQAIALVLYVIYRITFNMKKKECIKYGGDVETIYNSTKYGKILSFFTFQFFIFWTFFNMINQLVAIALIPEGFQAQTVPLVIFNAACIIICICSLFLKRKDIPSYTEVLYRKDKGH